MCAGAQLIHMEATMPRKSTNPKPNDALIAAYQAVNQHWSHAEDERWSILYNFITGNSILVLAWAAALSAPQPWRSVAASALPVAGLVLCIIWIIIECRTNTFIMKYGQLGEELEKKLSVEVHAPFHRGEQIRDEVKKAKSYNFFELILVRDQITIGRWMSAGRVVVFVPMIFVVVYLVFLIAYIHTLFPA